MNAAIKGAIVGVIVTALVRWVGRHAISILIFFGIGIVLMYALDPFLNDDANRDEMRSVIQYVSVERYDITPESVGVTFDNRSRFEITDGIVTCAGTAVNAIPVTIAPKTMFAATFAYEGARQPCRLSYTPVETVKYRKGTYAISSGE